MYKEDAVIGIDLGTSQTKVVVSAPNVDLHYAVQFYQNDQTIDGYLQPTLIHCGDSNQETSLSAFIGSSPNSNLKLNFINWVIEVGEKDFKLGSSQCARVVAYLAHIIQWSKNFFKQKVKSELPDQDFEWMFNLGIPASNLKEEVLCKAFGYVAFASWDLSINKKPLSIENALTSWRNIQDENYKPGGTHKDYINIYPELASQIFGFNSSKHGRDGLYLMIDVGAGTMDVSLFEANIKINNPNIRYTGCVEMLGALELFLDARSAIRKDRDHNTWGGSFLPDNMATLPFNKLKTNNRDLNTVINSSKLFLDKCWQAVYREIFRAKQVYFGKSAPSASKFINGLPYFLCGGGSSIPVYNRIVDKLIKPMSIYHFKGFQKEILNKPDNLNAPNIDSENYHRLSVAYGLSHLIINLPAQKAFKDTLLNTTEQKKRTRTTRSCRLCGGLAAIGNDLCYSCGFDA